MIKNSKTEDAQGRRERYIRFVKIGGKENTAEKGIGRKTVTEFLEKKKEMEEGRRKRT